MLQVTAVHTAYGNIEALHGVSIEVREGEIVTLIGANCWCATTTTARFTSRAAC